MSLILICAAAMAIDGDTIRCEDGTRIRVAGIEANEMRGGCHLTACSPVPGRVAKARMQAIVGGQNVTYVVTGKSWGRVTASVQLPDGRDLSCVALSAGFVVRWDRYWPKGKTCAR